MKSIIPKAFLRRVTVDRRSLGSVAFLILILAGAAVLRLHRLSSIPPGVWVDEAIEGLQGQALLNGQSLPQSEAIPFPRWPVWCGLEAVSISILGCTPLGIRMPAAIAGVATVILAYIVMNRLVGGLAGIAASCFLAFSFWHVNFSRMALPCTMAIPESLVVAAVLLSPSAVRWRDAAVVALVCAVALVGYASSMISPLLVLVLASLRFGHWQKDHKQKSIAVVLFFVVLCEIAVGWFLKPEALTRAVAIGVLPLAALGRQLVTCVGHLFVSAHAFWGYWYNFPPGAPRLAPVESAALILGIYAMATSPLLARWQKVGIVLWISLAQLPEILPGGGIHMIRALPLLAPLSLLIGFGVENLRRNRGGRVAWAALLLLASAGATTTHRLFFRFADSATVASWYLKADADAASFVKFLAAKSPVAIVPPPAYESGPLLRFHLDRELDEGAIVGTSTDLVAPVLAKVFRDPVSQQPYLCVFRSKESLNRRLHCGVVSIEGMLAYGKEDLRARRLSEAERHFRAVLDVVPDSASAQGALGVAEAMAGKWRQAIPHLEVALEFGIRDMDYELWLAKARQHIRE